MNRTESGGLSTDLVLNQAGPGKSRTFHATMKNSGLARKEDVLLD